MQVILKNDFTDEKMKFMSPSMDVVRGTTMVFPPGSRGEYTHIFHLAGYDMGKLAQRYPNGDEHQISGRWTLVSVSDDTAYLWNINDVADVYEENFDDPDLAPDKEEAETIIESVGSYDHVNHAVRMAILEEIKITLAERE